MTVSLKISPRLEAELKSGAVRNKVSKSEYMRRLLEEGVRRQSKRRSLREALQGAIGCFDSGVSDKSTNPKYMKGFGKWRS